eukprot:TRINITY_DN258_c0_g1_i1.p1 TRINITY_DN258_c0_g1~~TRINITY_DN258_c0_g1_i1.p1  ORF type:complete len:124 (+),score=24.37 TRINITY_DN258_c0_g1_i1:22-393(+)
MTKGTASFGPRQTKSHRLCPRCNKRSMHTAKKTCASCGYPSARLRKYNWAAKALRRRTTGTGRCRYLKIVHRKFSNGFREGTVALSKKANIELNKKRHERKVQRTQKLAQAVAAKAAKKAEKK